VGCGGHGGRCGPPRAQCNRGVAKRAGYVWSIRCPSPTSSFSFRSWVPSSGGVPMVLYVNPANMNQSGLGWCGRQAEAAHVLRQLALRGTEVKESRRALAGSRSATTRVKWQVCRHTVVYACLQATNAKWCPIPAWSLQCHSLGWGNNEGRWCYVGCEKVVGVRMYVCRLAPRLWYMEEPRGFIEEVQEGGKCSACSM